MAHQDTAGVCCPLVTGINMVTSGIVNPCLSPVLSRKTPALEFVQLQMFSSKVERSKHEVKLDEWQYSNTRSLTGFPLTTTVFIGTQKKSKIPLGGIYKSLDVNVSILPGDMMLRINISMW